MVAVFGLGEPQHDHLVPLDRLVEAQPAVSIHDLAREGLLVPGTEARIQGLEGHAPYHLAVREPGKVLLDGQEIHVCWHPALPLRCWICPRCQCDRYKLHRVGGVWACRKCHQLTHLCRHRWRTVPRLHRIRFLRRRIGAADLTPFTPLPAKPLHARRHWRIVREIRQLERALLEHTRRDVAAVLENSYAKQP